MKGCFAGFKLSKSYSHFFQKILGEKPPLNRLIDNSTGLLLGLSH
jgi:hypothetical protein